MINHLLCSGRRGEGGGGGDRQIFFTDQLWPWWPANRPAAPGPGAWCAPPLTGVHCHRHLPCAFSFSCSWPWHHLCPPAFISPPRSVSSFRTSLFSLRFLLPLRFYRSTFSSSSSSFFHSPPHFFWLIFLFALLFHQWLWSSRSSVRNKSEAITAALRRDNSAIACVNTGISC